MTRHMMRLLRISTYIVGFLFTIHLVLPVYVNSTYLGEIFGERYVGFVYALAAVVAICCIVGASKLMKVWGAYKTTMLLFAFELIALLVLAFVTSPLFVLIAFALHFSLSITIPFQLDIFLEHASEDTETGNIRGLFLTILNLAWVITPLITGSILGSEENFREVYIASVIALIPVYILSLRVFRNYKDARYKVHSLKESLSTLIKNKDLLHIFNANLLLKIFFSWMVIYTPLYMHEYLGLDFSIIGIIHTIILLAYVCVELPLGILADRVLGEKELLVSGFIVLAISTASLTFLSSTSWIFWAIILFITRLGAASVEVMSETYFFKKTSSKDTPLLSLFRMTTPLSYIIGPLLAVVYLALAPFESMFLAIGIVMLLGIIPSACIKDTR